MDSVPHVERKNRVQLEAAVVTPEQYFSRRQRPMSGTYLLMAAVLEDAFALVRRDHGSVPRRAMREVLLVRDTQRWFRSNDRSWLFSFLRICEALDLDPRAVRRALRGSAPAVNSSSRFAARVRRPRRSGTIRARSIGTSRCRVARG
jgi:hypothetical protein